MELGILNMISLSWFLTLFLRYCPKNILGNNNNHENNSHDRCQCPRILKYEERFHRENERRGRVRKEKMKRGTAFPTPYFFVDLSLVFFREWSFLYRARTKPPASQATCMTKAPLSLATALPSPPPYIVHRDLVGVRMCIVHRADCRRSLLVLRFGNCFVWAMFAL